MITSVQVKTSTRKQRINSLLAQPAPSCTSTEYKHEYYKIMWMLRELLVHQPQEVRDIWMTNMLSDALKDLRELDDPTSSPLDSRKSDNRRWTDIMVRRMIAERLWDEGESTCFYDCYDVLREGRSKAAQLRLYEQVRTCWETVTGTDFRTDFSITA